MVLFTGLPGTGKSTMADAVARVLGSPALAGDWLLGALAPAAETLATVDRATYLELYRSRLRSLITRQLMLGQSAVVDCVVPDAVIGEWKMLTARFDGAFFGWLISTIRLLSEHWKYRRTIGVGSVGP